MINPSEEFYYLQNKSKHYYQLNKAKPVVKDKLDTIHFKTLNMKNNQTSYKHQKDNQNQRISERLIQIKDGKSHLSKHPQYSRNNNFEKQFRKRSPYSDKVAEEIKLANSIYFNKKNNVKPSVGSVKQWVHQYEKNRRYGHTARRYLQGNKSKNCLHLSIDKFIPEHIKSYAKIHKDSNSSQKSISIPPLQLHELPKIKRPFPNIQSLTTRNTSIEHDFDKLY